METSRATAAFTALSHEHRLAIYRLLVQRGADGLVVGAIARALGLPNATLSFHLKTLVDAGLVTTQQRGRSILCIADFAHMNALVGFLTENCCRGETCCER